MQARSGRECAFRNEQQRVQVRAWNVLPFPVALLAALLLATPVGSALGAGAGGFYVAAGAGSADVSDDRPGLAVDDSDTAFTGFIGYNLLDNIAIEAGLADLGDFSATAVTGPAELEIDGALIGVRGQFEVGDHLYLQGRFGVFLWDADTTLRFPGSGASLSDDGEDLYYGVGGRWDFAKHWGASLDYTRFETDDFDVDLVGATLYYSFDF